MTADTPTAADMHTTTRRLKTTVPTGWKMVRLEDIAEVIGGTTPSKAEETYWNGHIPWVVPSELSTLPGRYLTITRHSITTKGMKSAGLRLIPSGSVLLTSRATIGVTAINTMPVVTNQGFQNLVAKKGIHSLWLFYWISAMRQELERRASGSTFREISRANVRSIPIFVPPLPEQQAIASILDAIDEAIGRTGELITATEQLRDALRHQLLTRGLPGRHTSWRYVPGLKATIPTEWKVVRLGDVAEVGAGDPAPQDKKYFEGGIYPFIRTQDVGRVRRSGNFYDSKDKVNDLALCDHRLKLWPTGTSLIPKSGASTALNNRVRLAKPAYVSGHLATVSAMGKIMDTFLYHLLCRLDARQLMGNSGYPSLNLQDLRSARIPLPPLAEQKAIAAILDSVDTAVECHRAECDALKGLKASAADALLTGRVRVPAGLGGSSG